MHERLRFKSGATTMLEMVNSPGSELTFEIPDWRKIPVADDKYTEYATDEGGNWSDERRFQSRLYRVIVKVHSVRNRFHREIHEAIALISQIRPLIVEFEYYEEGKVILETFVDSKFSDEVIFSRTGRLSQNDCALLNRSAFKTQTIDGLNPRRIL